jgi:lambda family phage portal protein
MSFISNLMNRMGYVTKKSARRAFEAAKGRSVLEDWLRSNQHIDEELKGDLRPLVSRARQLCQNEPGAAGFVKVFRRNVFGSQGITLQMKVKDPAGTMDKRANDQIETAWWGWGQKKNCTVTRDTTWRQLQWLAGSLLISDGEVIARKITGFQNDHRFALQLIDPILLPTDYNQNRTNNTPEIVMGVEKDKYGAAVAYHFRKAESTADFTGYSTGDYVRVPADQIIHLFPKYRTGQTRGWPLIVPAMMTMKMLGGYEEAEVVAARAGAAKLGFIKSPIGDEFVGEPTGSGADGSKYMDFEPGSINQLAAGQDFVGWDPSHPNTAYAEFVKAVKQTIASGLGMSYPTFSGDLEGVNFSSIRAGLLEEREEWKYLQALIIDDFCTPVFEAWLETVLTTQKVPLPLSKYEKFNSPQWTGRRWPWVDPEKDLQASILSIDNGLMSKTEIVNEQGRDYEDVLLEIKTEKDLEQKIGVELNADKKMNIEKEAALAAKEKPAPEKGKGKAGVKE